MVLGAVLTSRGHHSEFEIMILARNLGFPVQYNHQFYHNSFITKEFRESKAYKDFLAEYPMIIDSLIVQKVSENQHLPPTGKKAKTTSDVSQTEEKKINTTVHTSLSLLETDHKISDKESKEFEKNFGKEDEQKNHEKIPKNFDEIFYLKSFLSNITNKNGEALTEVFKEDMSTIRKSLVILDDSLWLRQKNYWIKNSFVEDEKSTGLTSGSGLFTKEPEPTLPFYCSFHEAIQHQIKFLEEVNKVGAVSFIHS